MTFGSFLLLLTLVTLAVNWLLFFIFDQTEDGPTFLQTLITPGRYPPQRFRGITSTVFLVIGLGGLFYFS